MNLNSKNNTPEIEKKSPIITLDAFIERQNEIQKNVDAGFKRWSNHMKLLNNILDFQSALTLFYGKSIDPIDFLHNLYYKENQSFITICETITSIFQKTQRKQNVFKKANTIQKFTRDRLNWQLKDQKESKNTISYRWVPRNETQKKVNAEKEEKREILFISWFIENSTKINKENFDDKKLNSFKYDYEKFIYMIKNVFWIKKEDFLKLKELWFWTPFIAKMFNKTFDENKILFNVSDQNIRLTFLNINKYESI